MKESTCASRCGDSIRAEVELCDNGNQIGCTKNCVPDKGYSCPTVDSKGKSICSIVCSDSIRLNSEECDNGKQAGCTLCKIEPGYKCRDVSNPDGTVKSVCDSLCGNGILDGTEACDDGNTFKGDGCSNECKVEPGFRCYQPLLLLRGPSICYRSLF